MQEGEAVWDAWSDWDEGGGGWEGFVGRENTLEGEKVLSTDCIHKRLRWWHFRALTLYNPLFTQGFSNSNLRGPSKILSYQDTSC